MVAFTIIHTHKHTLLYIQFLLTLSSILLFYFFFFLLNQWDHLICNIVNIGTISDMFITTRNYILDELMISACVFVYVLSQ